MILAIFTAAVSFIVALVCIPLLIKFSYSKNIFDYPSIRKTHSYPVSFFGGVAIFIAVVFSMTAIVPSYNAGWLQYLLASSVMVFLLGLQDDVLFLSPTKKFIGQLIAVFILVQQGHFQLFSLYGFMGIHTLSNTFSIVFTYLTILLIINAYNLIDGVDGLAGTLSLISTIFFGIVFFMNNEYVFAALSFSIAAALSAFLVYNVTPSKIFLGDTGSMLLGLLNASLVIKFINLETSGGVFFHDNAASVIGLAVLFIPIADTIRVMVIRLFKRKSPFVGDQNHIHHLLLKRGYSHIKITFLLSTSTAFLIFYSIIFRSFGVTFLLFSMALIFFIILILFMYNSSVNGYAEQKRSVRSSNQLLSDKKITSDGEIEGSGY